MNPTKAPDATIAQSIVRLTTPTEQQVLLEWARGILAIRNGSLPAHRKAAEALALTKRTKAIVPLLKVLSRELKRVGWDERSWKTRLGLGAVAATVITVGNAGAGIAALGGGIGVPLWIVLGAGGAFAGVLVEELTKAVGREKPRTTYTIIEATKELPRK